MKLILHIGKEKTGTTSIQSYLRRDFYDFKNKIYYFPRDLTGWDSNRAFTSIFDNNLNYNYYKRQKIDSLQKYQVLKEQIMQDFEKQFQIASKSKIQHFVISTENLSTNLLTVEQLEKLKTFIFSYFTSVKIICFFKDQFSDAVSRYSQYIKMGGTNDWESFLNKIENTSPLWNQNLFAHNLSSVFRKDELFFENYFDNNGNTQNIVNIFYKRYLPYTSLNFSEGSKNQNKKLGYLGTQCLRIANEKYPRFSSIKNDKIRHSLIRKITRIDCGDLGKVYQIYKKTLIEKFSSSNQLFEKRYLIGGKFHIGKDLPQMPEEEKKIIEAKIRKIVSYIKISGNQPPDF